MDILFKGSSLIWPCFAASVLYLYLFIIQSDLKIDSLTGIGNRSSFNEFIDKISHQSSKLEYSIVMIDMDKFKEINDTLGHLEGDNALRDIARIIKACIRHLDFVARYGGDEFILATKADSDIQTLMYRILDAIDQQNKKRIRPYQLYISYGYDVFTTNSGESIADFLTKIDTMMYKQKEERKIRGIPSSITANLPDYKGTQENV
jgi:diguanylate cyclase (GGDEF)-like protein